MTGDEQYMHRCLQLAQLAAGDVAPNPMVGAVLVHEGKIIGEGYHQQYGKAHAEINCLASIAAEDLHLVSSSTLYVSLEPCAHFGKTPPCADLLIEKKIPRVVVGCRDPFPEVNGKGIEKLRAAGVDVSVGVLEERCRNLNKRFFTFHTQHRPYIILKWAQTGDRKIARLPIKWQSPDTIIHSDKNISNKENRLSGEVGAMGYPLSGSGEVRLLISNAYTNRLVHKWRSEEQAIMVGTNTALSDDPELSTRNWPGHNPVRVLVDRNLRLPSMLKLFNGKVPTVVFNLHQHSLPFEKISVAHLRELGVSYYQITEDASLVHQVLNGLYRAGIQSMIVEGGARLLQSFIDEGLWDEARVISNEELFIGEGLPAPDLREFQLVKTEKIVSDTIRYFQKKER
ncbi:MAG TPA: bifunctional diaminohydroxyphosphoribosylaminopyrimidine deaminase/5-amino-6-(5-phosphoribosylamino)uracil reductase RibD [Flavisolibacter sp.]|nr:bifunctional diaminohydroxyphosphoribosylaminopyrimidine deaminase/5-amino-6-(5-phosphoribosylamino)uracil reductase RibD [Flavisolibacter sp.]